MEDVGRGDLHHHRIADLLSIGDGFISRRAEVGFGDTDAVSGQDIPAFGVADLDAVVGPDFLKDSGDGFPVDVKLFEFRF